MSDTIRYSVVTVCLNAETTIEKTINSILDQTEQSMEYIIMDGDSRDNTLTLIQKYISDTRIKVYSKQDNGLYNAMNHSLDHCKGEYIIFMNSGDIFHNKDTLKNMSERMKENNLSVDIYYGDVIRNYESKSVHETYEGRFTLMKLLLMGKMPCHQSMFVKLDIMKKYCFNEKYFITADYNFIMKCRKENCTIVYTNMIIADVDSIEGISSKKENLKEMRRQDDMSLKEIYPVWYSLVMFPKKIYRVLIDIREK